MLLKTLDTATLNYIKELETRYEQKYQALELNYQRQTKELKQIQYEYLDLKERYDLLMYKRFVRSSEVLLADKKQPLLFNAEEQPVKTAVEEEHTYEVKSFTRKKAGRKGIDPKIPREDRIIDMPESEKSCACGAILTKIGEESSEKLHIIPPRIYVERIIRPKYACRSCEGTEDEQKPVVRIAEVEPSIIPKSIASPSLLSCIIVQKYEDHLPYYRQEKQFHRVGVELSRQDMSNWQVQVFKKLAPLFELLEEQLKTGPVMQMDETTVQVMGEEGREDTQKSRMWVARGGPPEEPVVLYKYRQTRSAYHAKEMLEGYSGYLQTDGYEGYDAAIKDMPGILHVGCFAHTRRKFFEAAKISSQAGTAQQGIGYIKSLYVIEAELRKEYEKDEETEKFLDERKLRTKPVLEEFKIWLLRGHQEVPPTLLLGKAIGYSLSQWDKLVRYLESPYLTPDNNACENAIRPFVLGRKNWLFNKSPEGADSSCGMYSLIQTAKHNGLNPAQYLTTVFQKAPMACSVEDWKKLLPWNIFK